MEFTFLLKKIIAMALMPLPIGMLLFLIGIIYLYKQNFIRAKIILSLTFLWIFLISYEPLVNTILHKYESKYPALLEVPTDIQYIYVLGNTHHTDKTQPITSQVSEIASIRLAEGIRLYHLLDEKPTIIVSGYSGLFDPTPGAVMQQKLALSLGVKAGHIHMEPLPQDTHEEAMAAKKYIGKKPFALVTSASHMQRALLFFQHEGLHPYPAPTNHLANIKHPNYVGIFSPSALRRAHLVWHEILGQLWQSLKGIS